VKIFLTFSLCYLILSLSALIIVEVLMKKRILVVLVNAIRRSCTLPQKLNCPLRLALTPAPLLPSPGTCPGDIHNPFRRTAR